MKKIAVIITCVIAFAGCSKDFFDLNNPNQLADGTFWLSTKDAYYGVNGIYNSLCTNALYAGGLNNLTGLPMFDCYGDNGFNQWMYEGAGNYMTGNIDPSYYSFSNFWSALYTTIGRANVAIDNIQKMPSSVITDSIRNNLIGQAKFLRALSYMNLAIYFQDVPLILKPQTLDESYVPKNAFKEVYDSTIADLKFAASVLPVVYPTAQTGYATQGAALGLLARMYLYNKDYQGVLDATNAIINLNYYSLNASYSTLFTPSGETSKEILFQVRFSTATNDNKETFSCTYGGTPKVDELPMPNFVNDFYCTDGKPITTSPKYSASTPKANRDPRLTATVYFKGDVFITDVGTVFNTTPHATNYGLKNILIQAGQCLLRRDKISMLSVMPMYY